MKNSLLWRLSPPSGGPDSYLFGTMHVRDLRAFQWLDLAQKCLSHCSVFATEFDFSETDPAAVASVLKLPEGTSLDQWVKPGVWKRLDRQCRKKLGVPVEQLRFQHPMSIAMLLTGTLLQQESDRSLDETLWAYARGLDKTTTGVETFEEQLQTLQKMPFQYHIDNLIWLLKNYGRQKRRLKKMLHWYAEGDVQQLYQAARKDAKGMRNLLLYERNILMAKRFQSIANETSLFCAVGAGHLAGQKGLLRMLKKAGFKIRAVLPDAKG
ncbi:MAG: TraB/GumN family protein [Saprospiraceae bacterium]|nr:TraB/GumN family protein [Saprospiraceae bacterium]